MYRNTIIEMQTERQIANSISSKNAVAFPKTSIEEPFPVGTQLTK